MQPFGGLRILPFERLLFSDDTLAIGEHRLSWPHRDFESYGPTSSYLFVFPRTTTLIQHAGEEPIVGSPSVAMLYNRGQEYRRRKISDEGDFCEWFAVAPETLREIVRELDPAAAESDRLFRVRSVPVTPADYLRQRIACERADDRLFVQETMLRLFARLLARAYASAEGTPTSRQKELARRAAEVLASAYALDWPLQQIARACETTPFHLARTFRRVTGTSLHQHRLMLRLAQSLTLLRDTHLDLTTIALDLGFSDHSHFTSAFRSRFGVTPSAYRSGGAATAPVAESPAGDCLSSVTPEQSPPATPPPSRRRLH